MYRVYKLIENFNTHYYSYVPVSQRKNRCILIRAVCLRFILVLLQSQACVFVCMNIIFVDTFHLPSMYIPTCQYRPH